MAFLDLPASIAYVKQITGVDQIAYVYENRQSVSSSLFRFHVLILWYVVDIRRVLRPHSHVRTFLPRVLYRFCSQLTQILFVVFSDKGHTSTSESVRVFVALAPVIFLGHMSVPILVDLTKLPPLLYESVLGNGVSPFLFALRLFHLSILILSLPR